MSSAPAVSVIMAVYNEAEHLPATLESIRQQTFTDYELIIIDDGSTDKTWQIVESLERPRLRTHRNLPNRGQTASLNLALTLSSGKYIARHDAEDSSDPTRFEKQVRYLDRHPDVALVGSLVDWVDSTGSSIRHFEYPTEHDDIVERLKTKNSFGHGAVMFRREALGKVGAYREEFQLAQDYELWLRLSEKFKVANLPETLYRMRFSTRMSSVARNAEQNAYAALARQLAAERREAGGEETDLEASAEALRQKYERANPFARRAERARNLISWANRLLWWGGPAARYAWPVWSSSLTAWPFNVDVWKFLARQVRDQLQSEAKDTKPSDPSPPPG